MNQKSNRNNLLWLILAGIALMALALWMIMRIAGPSADERRGFTWVEKNPGEEKDQPRLKFETNHYQEKTLRIQYPEGKKYPPFVNPDGGDTIRILNLGFRLFRETGEELPFPEHYPFHILNLQTPFSLKTRAALLHLTDKKNQEVGIKADSNSIDSILNDFPAPHPYVFTKGPTSRWEEAKTFEIPLPSTLFQQLPEGEHEVLLEFALFHPWTHHKIPSFLEKSQEIPGTRGKIKFKTKVPRILKTQVSFGTTKILDSAFSSGWDPAIFGPGTPDLVFELRSRDNGGGLTQGSYFTSPKFTNEQVCPFNTSFILYHTSLKNKVSLTFYDSDDLGRDDRFDSWEGSIQSMLSDTSFVKISSFKRIEVMEVKAQVIEEN